jgi:hypothetical protein
MLEQQKRVGDYAGLSRGHPLALLAEAVHVVDDSDVFDITGHC